MVRGNKYSYEEFKIQKLRLESVDSVNHVYTQIFSYSRYGETGTTAKVPSLS